MIHKGEAEVSAGQLWTRQGRAYLYLPASKELGQGSVAGLRLERDQVPDGLGLIITLVDGSAFAAKVQSFSVPEGISILKVSGVKRINPVQTDDG